MNNNPHDYLDRLGFTSSQSKPMPNDRRLTVKAKAIGVKGSTRGKGSLGSMSTAGTRARGIKVECNESARYEAAETKTLKGVKKAALRTGRQQKGSISPMGKNTKKGQKA